MAPLQLTTKQQQYQHLRMCKQLAAGRESVTAIAHQYGVSRKTADKWFARWEAGGRTEIQGQSSAMLPTIPGGSTTKDEIRAELHERLYISSNGGKLNAGGCGCATLCPCCRAWMPTPSDPSGESA